MNVRIDDLVAAAGALSDVSRVRALMALQRGELCVCQIIEMLGLAPSTVSKHMSVLKQVGLVKCSKAGRWIYYRLPEVREMSPFVKKTLDWMDGAISCDRIIELDRQNLARIINQDPNKICRRQRRRRNEK